MKILTDLLGILVNLGLIAFASHNLSSGFGIMAVWWIVIVFSTFAIICFSICITMRVRKTGWTG